MRACHALILVHLAACSRNTDQPRPGDSAPIAIDGSSTVFPITEAVAEEFQKSHPGRRVTIGVSGTGGGMKKFCAGELAIAGASRPIRPDEALACAAAGVGYIELPVAYDGIVIVVNPVASWADSITAAELQTIWSPGAQGRVTRWSQVREGWPDQELHLYGPGVDSGTYDYFTKAIVGNEHSSRGDFTSSEDDNVLVQGVATDPSALGFFGLSWYTANRDKLKALRFDPNDGVPGVLPASESVEAGSYQPLSRPVFLYVSLAASARPEVQEFVYFYLDEGRSLVAEVGCVPLPDRAYGLVRQRFDARMEGSAFKEGGSAIGIKVEELLRMQR